VDAPTARVSSELKAALKAGDKERLSTLRLLLTELNNEALRSGREIDEAGFQAIVKRAIKQRRESAEAFRKGERPELAAKEEREAEILGEFLPKQASEEEIRAVVAAIVAEQGLSGPAALGALMKAALGRLGGAADGATVNRIARDVLNQH
jgi:uncharacterized protein YqeY